VIADDGTYVADKECLAAEADIAKQDLAKAKEIEVSKKDFDRYPNELQSAVNFVRYDLLDTPEPGRRGKLIIARKRDGRR
jgi:hypothetical protein